MNADCIVGLSFGDHGICSVKLLSITLVVLVAAKCLHFPLLTADFYRLRGRVSEIFEPTQWVCSCRSRYNSRLTEPQKPIDFSFCADFLLHYRSFLQPIEGLTRRQSCYEGPDTSQQMT